LSDSLVWGGMEAKGKGRTMSDREIAVQQPTAIAQRQGGLALSTFDDAWRFAQLVSKTDFAPKDFRGKPESCLLAIQHGAEIGLSPMQSMQQIAVINGRPSIWGDAALALAMSSPSCEWVRERVEGEGEKAIAICECKRRGDPEPKRVVFTVADAKKAGLWTKQGPWSQYPMRMLQLRARGFALRDAFPDVLRGLVTAEEARDYTSGSGTSVYEQPPAMPEHKEPPATDPREAEQKARTAISRAKNVEQLDSIRKLIATRHAEGVFSDDVKDDLVDLAVGKAELLMSEVPA